MKYLYLKVLEGLEVNVIFGTNYNDVVIKL